MPKKNEEPLERLHIWVFESDVARINALLPNTRTRSYVLRMMIHKYLNSVDARVSAKIDAQEAIDAALEDIRA